MDFKNDLKEKALKEFYDLFKKFGFNSFKKINLIINRFKEVYYKGYKGEAPGQSWRVWKGNLFEDLIYKLIGFYVENSNIDLAKETDLGKKDSEIMQKLRDQTLIKYTRGEILPDSDVILYNKQSLKVLAILSCKTSFRDRISMVGYWSLKLKEKSIKYIFITLDEDEAFSTISSKRKKARLILEDTDGAFILNENVKEDSFIKNFSHFKSFLDNLIKDNK